MQPRIPRLIHTLAKLFYSISVSYHSSIVFYTVETQLWLQNFFKSETEAKDKQPKTRVQRLEKASFQQAWKLDYPWLFQKVNFGYYVTISWTVERLVK